MLELQDASLLVSRCLIGGEWIAGGGETVAVDDPATGGIVGHVPAAGEAETAQAIAAAATALKEWRKRPAAERAALLERWHELVLANVEDLARIMTAEQGKPLPEARDEIRYGASFIKWFAEEARRIHGGTVPAPASDRRILTLKEPVGVCAIITPWNFPNAMITRKVAPALAAGCTVIVKPSEFTPYSALALGVLAERAGIPGGVINILTGLPQAIGKTLLDSDIVRKVSFTGSTRVGSLLMAGSAPTVKRLSLELGGNAPFIVFDDADLDAAVEGALASKFRNGGQTCVCANRLLVHERIYDAFADRLAQRVNALKVGPGFAEGTQIGPMINDAAVEKINDHVADALARGARNLTPRTDLPQGRRYVAPVVLADAAAGMRLADEETFGPVAPLFRFRTDDEAIAFANGTPFGLAAYFFTQNLKRAFTVGEALEFGMVGLNTGSISMAVAPFGGVKQSGLGREGGREGIEEYLETKAFHIGGLNG
ncbi:MAG: NAD-dependent succinate-semialdehyde dehydrogenase [Pseudochelatococcus sp.]|jgi:succinate-semialdehyde dehydrogenase/glutarate-semialdehyde dehydrogenase|uniref:NAD-dependent succinate-semialdehyde dehydrogenase n=1 Tax=Pseudochelatococcus sp. TaxID=2020869 RepID=UPI003D8A4317